MPRTVSIHGAHPFTTARKPRRQPDRILRTGHKCRNSPAGPSKHPQRSKTRIGNREQNPACCQRPDELPNTPLSMSLLELLGRKPSRTQDIKRCWSSNYPANTFILGYDWTVGRGRRLQLAHRSTEANDWIRRSATAPKKPSTVPASAGPKTIPETPTATGSSPKQAQNRPRRPTAAPTKPLTVTASARSAATKKRQQSQPAHGQRGYLKPSENNP